MRPFKISYALLVSAVYFIIFNLLWNIYLTKEVGMILFGLHVNMEKTEDVIKPLHVYIQ